ncbi:MAG: hypothetical protein SGI94_17475 [Saprospiraceae bacterium]|nr:hypothetical protein [Saprospiraceae bacterium]
MSPVFIQARAISLILNVDWVIYAQGATIWKGATPGRETDWHCPSNWSTHAAPNEFSDVVIPDVATSTCALPVIFAGEVEVNALYIHPNAGLTQTQFEKRGHIPYLAAAICPRATTGFAS